MKHLEQYIIAKAEYLQLKSEVHQFDSGAMMIDIWYAADLIVVQIDEQSIGLSIVNDDNPGFGTIPDRAFTDEVEFKKAFDTVFIPLY